MRNNAPQNIVRMQLVNRFKLGDMTSHLRILKDLQKEPVTKARDIMTVKFNFKKSFKVIVMERHE